MDLRGRHSLVTEVFLEEQAALTSFHRRIAPSSDGVIFEVYRAGAGSGFFEGIPSEGLLRACLASGYEGAAVVSPSLHSGTILDVVRDDPLKRDFFEVESWS